MPIGATVTISNEKYTVTDVKIAPDRKTVTYTVKLFDRFSACGVRDTRKLVKHADAMPAISKCA